MAGVPNQAGYFETEPPLLHPVISLFRRYFPSNFSPEAAAGRCSAQFCAFLVTSPGRLAGSPIWICFQPGYLYPRYQKSFLSRAEHFVESEHSSELDARQVALFGQLDLSWISALQLVLPEEYKACWDKEKKRWILKVNLVVKSAQQWDEPPPALFARLHLICWDKESKRCFIWAT